MQVTVVGRITNVMENNMNLDITIHDGTGQLRMTHFINDDSEQVRAHGQSICSRVHISQDPTSEHCSASTP